VNGQALSCVGDDIFSEEKMQRVERCQKDIFMQIRRDVGRNVKTYRPLQVALWGLGM